MIYPPSTAAFLARGKLFHYHHALENILKACSTYCYVSNDSTFRSCQQHHFAVTRKQMPFIINEQHRYYSNTWTSMHQSNTTRSPLAGLELLSNNDYLSDSPIHSMLSKAPLALSDIYKAMMMLQNDPGSTMKEITNENFSNFMERMQKPETVGKENLLKLKMRLNHEKHHDIFVWIHNNHSERLPKDRCVIVAEMDEKRTANRFLISTSCLQSILVSINERSLLECNKISGTILTKLLSLPKSDVVEELKLVSGLEMMQNDSNEK